MLRHLYRSIVLTALLAGAASGQGAGAPEPYLFRAATATVGGKPEVRLRWQVTEGWIPDGRGFNVYRVEGGRRIGPLNGGAPISVHPELASPPPAARRVRIGGAGPVSAAGSALDFRATLALARQSVPGATQRELFQMLPQGRPVASASAVFDAMAAKIRALRSMPGPALPPAAFRQQVLEEPVVRDYVRRILGVRVGGAAGPAARMPMRLAAGSREAQIASIRRARTTLLVGALTHDDLGQALGLRYTDSAVVPGATYHYVLAFVDPAGKESEVAHTDLVAGHDAQPVAPEGLKATQLDADTVALYWNHPTVQQQNDLLLPSYRVLRVDPHSPMGTPLNDKPLLDSALHSGAPGSGEVLEPYIKFRDGAAPVGALTYRVTMVDAFGRESAPASVAVTVADWHTPAPPVHVYTALPAGAPGPVVEWTAAPNPDALYRIYRIDTEQALRGADRPQLITAAPTHGDPVKRPVVGKGARAEHADVADLSFTDAAAPPDHYYRYLVTAVYARNGLDSSPTISPVVGVPLAAPPASPTGLTSRFTAGPSSPVEIRPGETSLPHVGLSTGRAGALHLQARTRRVASIQPAVPVHAEAEPPRFGGLLTLSWNHSSEPGQPFTYRVYRQLQELPHPAIVSAPLAVAGIPIVSLKNRAVSSAAGIRPAAGGRTSAAPPAAPSVARISSAAMRTVLNAAAATHSTGNAVTLVGEVKDATTIVDHLPPAQSLPYRYWVVPVTRWGVEGKPAQFDVRIEPTLDPTAPGLVSAGPDPDHRDHILLTIHANLQDEDVVKYHVYRFEVAPLFTYAPDSSTHTAGGGTGKLPTTAGSQEEADEQQQQADAWAKKHPRRVIAVESAMELLAREKLAGDLSPASKTLVSQLQTFSNYKEIVIPGKLPAVVDHPETAGETQMVDTTVEPLHDYAYRIVAENSRGLLSPPSDYLDARPDKISAAPPDLKLSSVSSRSALLGVFAEHGLTVLERAVGGGPFVTLEGPSALSFVVDATVIPGRTYHYRARTLDYFGNVSEPSAEVVVSVPKK